MRISDWSSDVCSSDLPDLLIKLHKVDGKRLYVLIEAKHLSGKSSGPSEDLTAPYDQLAREWDNLVCRCKKDEAEPLLIFLTADFRSEEHTSELQSLMRISYAVLCLTKKKTTNKPSVNPTYIYQQKY